MISRLSIRVSTKPCQMSFDCPFSFPQIPVHTPPTSPQALSRKEVDDNWEEVSSASDVVNWTPTIGYLARLPTKHNIVNQVFCRFEVHIRYLRFRLDSQSLVCVHSVDLRFSWLFWTVFLIISRGPTLFVFLYMSFA